MDEEGDIKVRLSPNKEEDTPLSNVIDKQEESSGDRNVKVCLIRGWSPNRCCILFVVIHVALVVTMFFVIFLCIMDRMKSYV